MPPIVQMVHSTSEPDVMRAMHAHAIQWDVWHFTTGRALVQTFDHLTGDVRRIWAGPGMTIYIPPGISHGFYTPTGCTLIYGLTREYDGTDEYEWDAYDPEFPGAGLWPIDAVRSDRDRNARSLAAFREAFPG